MNNIIDYQVVMFQGEDAGTSVFHSECLEECEKFAREQEADWQAFSENAFNEFPKENKPEFSIVANFDDGSAEFID